MWLSRGKGRKEEKKDTEARGLGHVWERDTVEGQVGDPFQGGHIKKKRNVKGVWKFLQRGERANTH